MEDSEYSTRRRVLQTASRWSKSEWIAVITDFYDALSREQPALYRHLNDSGIALPVQKVVSLLRMIANEQPDRQQQFQSVFLGGFDHLDRALERAEYAEFFDLLATVVAGTGYGTDRSIAHPVWRAELRHAAESVLRAAAD